MTVFPTIQGRQAVVKAIGNVCSFQKMDSMTHICYGEKVINSIASPADTQYRIADASLDWADRIGIEINLVSVILQASAGSETDDDVALRKVVQEVLPQAFDAAPSVSLKVVDVVLALNELKGSLADEKMQAAVSQSKEELQTVVGRVRSLTAYKQLHDNLHRLQLTSKRMLLKNARKVSTEEGKETLLNFVDEAMAGVAAATTEVANFKDAIATLVENSWINDLQLAANRIDAGVKAANIGAIGVGINQISILVDTQASRLNTLIFAETKGLPLLRLGNALAEMSSVSASTQHITKGVEAIRDLSRVLMSRVAAHNRLQEAEKNLSILADDLSHPDEMILSEFVELWPESKSTIGMLSAYKLDYGEEPFDMKTADAVEERLLAIEAAMDAPDNASKLAQLMTDLEQAFSYFHRMARRQFYKLDQKLKGDFNSLAGISSSLQSILQDLAARRA